MMRKILLSVVVIALLAPILVTLCQWQCHFMSSSESPMTHELLVPATHRMECCANQEVVLKKPLAAFTAKFAPARLLDAPLKMSEGILDRRFITHESPSGPTTVPAFISSSPILRI
jgi:hypothetical protein